MKKDMETFRKKNEETALMTKYIFPGGELDHIGNTVTNLEQFGFEVHDVENLREHYQRTCRRWHDRLLANYDAAVAESGEVVTRLWLAYLAGSSLQFERQGMRLYQTLASHKRRGRQRPAADTGGSLSLTPVCRPGQPPSMMVQLALSGTQSDKR